MKKIIFLLCLPLIATAAGNQSDGLPGGQQYAPQEVQRDPFTTSDKMYGQVGLQPGERANVYGGFIPGYGSAPQGLPKMRLRGYVTQNVSKKTALLEIQGVVFMVSEGDEIGLHAIGSSGVLKVIEVGRTGVKVQTGRVNQVIIVR